MAKELADKRCAPCRGGVPPLKGGAMESLRREIGAGWNVIAEHHLEKVYRFKNFRQALDFTNALGAIAEQERHHPEITLRWGAVTMRIWTRKIDGLTENDFILAAKADREFEKRDRKDNEHPG